MVGPNSIAAVVFVLLASPSVSRADADLERDGAIIAGATTVAVVLSALPIREQTHLRDHEWLRLDERVRDNFSERAAKASDVALVLTTTDAATFAIGSGEGAGDRALVLGESVAIALAATSVAKVAVARPRPYVYNDDERALRRRDRAGRDAYRSWFSGHAAMSFAAVAASGQLVASRNGSMRMRAAVWGSGAMLASSTANLRVRAGRHYYSDVIIGSLVGTAIGTVIPALHTGEVETPSGGECAAIAGGLALGVLASQVMPLGNGVAPRPVRVGPLLVRDGAGVAVGGLL